MLLFTLLISSPPSPSYSTSSFLLFHMTTWPSGLRRVTRNHFSSGGVGSNPAVVVFYTSFSIPFFPSSKKMVPPRFELGSREPESHMLPLHHGTFLSFLYSFPFTMPSYPVTLTPSFLSPLCSLSFSYTLSTLSSFFLLSFFFSYSPFPPSSLLFLSPLSHFFPFLPPFPFLKKTPPVGLEPTTLRLKAARSTD